MKGNGNSEFSQPACGDSYGFFERKRQQRIQPARLRRMLRVPQQKRLRLF
ncbi:MAG: hypothetical protein H7838_12760 [Magnetococcus sp. DMHC-8]